MGLIELVIVVAVFVVVPIHWYRARRTGVAVREQLVRLTENVSRLSAALGKLSAQSRGAPSATHPDQLSREVAHLAHLLLDLRAEYTEHSEKSFGGIFGETAHYLTADKQEWLRCVSEVRELHGIPFRGPRIGELLGENRLSAPVFKGPAAMCRLAGQAQASDVYGYSSAFKAWCPKSGNA